MAPGLNGVSTGYESQADQRSDHEVVDADKKRRKNSYNSKASSSDDELAEVSDDGLTVTSGAKAKSKG